MTSAYEEAVHLHNRGYVSHEVYQRQHECQLRSYVLAEQLERLDVVMIAAREHAASLTVMSGRLQERTNKIESTYQDWKDRFNGDGVFQTEGELAFFPHLGPNHIWALYRTRSRIVEENDHLFACTDCLRVLGVAALSKSPQQFGEALQRLRLIDPE